jgi:light-independent protochlorophyllide reductase subunit B
VKLAVWTYEGPPHVGAMRVATAMRGVHLLLHAPQGDTYADLLFTMIERRSVRPPVTFTTFQARDLGTDTAQLFQDALIAANDRFRPDAMLVGASCTAELIQDDPGGLAHAAGLGVPVVALELPSYSRKESWGAAETFLQLVKAFARRDAAPPPRLGRRPRANILGPCALGFRHRDDLRELEAMLDALGVDLWVTAPWDASPKDLARLGEADLTILPYPEIGDEAARWLERTFRQPVVRTVPYGAAATRAFIVEVAAVAGVDPAPALALGDRCRAPWWSASIDSTYLTGKRVFLFGEANRVVAAARVAKREMGFDVCGLGAYNREFARELRQCAAEFGLAPLITDDHLEVEEAIAAAAPELVLGTQMERHVAKRLGIACAVISAPFHVQDHPARHSPQLGFEGANVLFDAWVHPLTMGLEEHLLSMFRDDPEFHDAAGPSHLGPGHGSPVVTLPEPEVVAPAAVAEAAPAAGPAQWTSEAERELRKIPFFVRPKARRNTEAYARERGLAAITLDTLYEAKAHHGR